MANKGDVVTALTPVGEIIGRYKEKDNDGIILDSPRTFVQTDQGMGFAPGICMTGEANTKEAKIYSNMIVAIVKSSDEVEKAWMQATTGLVI